MSTTIAIVETNDVKRIAASLKFKLTDKEINEVIEKYNERCEEDIWYAVIENILYEDFAEKQEKKK
jgi:Ca2+-binding EF-hand superfamily protein